MNIENKVLQILAKSLSLNQKKINKPELLKWDSLKHISLITALEVEFDILFEPEEISEMLNYENIVKIIEYKLNN